ncbi:hypothetical protein ATO8_09733 [Roseivivax marinus]|uniref:Uncharacterized protein n=1 Tax=Roseivivax marinus TaxID=1379903 RepID=W4HJC3_9RHOB|nr:hypothetical protein [Roseivivax marinus]ETW12814.1 hypothetical protein ATO8_09733 [Roseivivax marinus]
MSAAKRDRPNKGRGLALFRERTEWPNEEERFRGVWDWLNESARLSAAKEFGDLERLSEGKRRIIEDGIFHQTAVLVEDYFEAIGATETRPGPKSFDNEELVYIFFQHELVRSRMPGQSQRKHLNATAAALGDGLTRDAVRYRLTLARRFLSQSLPALKAKFEAKDRGEDIRPRERWLADPDVWLGGLLNFKRLAEEIDAEAADLETEAKLRGDAPNKPFLSHSELSEHLRDLSGDDPEYL